ncbi:MAG TPA: hypothetical protein V6C98_04140 [Thermosynechococcaceae cyanobacterium]
MTVKPACAVVECQDVPHLFLCLDWHKSDIKQRSEVIFGLPLAFLRSTFLRLTSIFT